MAFCLFENVWEGGKRGGTMGKGQKDKRRVLDSTQDDATLKKC